MWLLLTIPLVTAPAAAGGLYYSTYELTQGRTLSAGVFIQGFRTYFGLSWRWFITLFGVLATLVVNFWFYGQVQTGWASTVQGIFLALIILWPLLNLYTYPLLLMQSDQRVRTALRNSLVIYVRRPWFSLALIVTLVAISIISIFLVLPSFMLLAGLSAYLVHRSLQVITKEIQ